MSCSYAPLLPSAFCSQPWLRRAQLALFGPLGGSLSREAANAIEEPTADALREAKTVFAVGRGWLNPCRWLQTRILTPPCVSLLCSEATARTRPPPADSVSRPPARTRGPRDVARVIGTAGARHGEPVHQPSWWNPELPRSGDSQRCARSEAVSGQVAGHQGPPPSASAASRRRRPLGGGWRGRCYHWQ